MSFWILDPFYSIRSVGFVLISSIFGPEFSSDLGFFSNKTFFWDILIFFSQVLKKKL